MDVSSTLYIAVQLVIRARHRGGDTLTRSTCGVAVLLALWASPVHADTLVLANGDAIHGEIIEWAIDHVVIEHPQLGKLRLELDQLKLDTGTPPNPGLFGTRFMRGWKRRVDLGLTGERDNDHTVSLTVGWKFNYKDQFKRWRLHGRYFYNADEDDGDDDNNATVQLRRDWLMPGSRWFYSLGSRYQFDDFEAWKHRITLLTGPGFHVIDAEKHALDLVIGPAFTREFGSSNANKSEGVVVVSYDWTISERQSIDFDNLYSLELAPNSGDWRNFTTLAWALRVTEHPAMSLSFGIQNEYDSKPDPGDNSNDFKYFLTLGLDL